MLTRYAEGIIRFRWMVIALTCITVVLAARGMGFLQFTNDYRAFFADKNPQMMAFDQLQNTYNKSDNVMFVLAPKDGKVFTAKTLASIEWLTEQAWQTPYSNRVDSITNFQHTRAVEDDLDVADLIHDANNLTPKQLAYAQAVALAEPQLRQRLISSDAQVTGINVNIQLPGKSLTEVPEVAAFARDLAAQLRARDDNLDIYLGGIVMMNNAFGESAQHDSATLVPLMFLVVILTLVILLRSSTGTLSSVLVIFMAIMIAMGLFGWSGYQLTSMTISAPTIILTMAVADCVHLLVSFFWGMHHGKQKHDAMVDALRINMLPIFITSVTTIVGFMSMNYSEVPPLAQLGNLVAIGVGAAFILSVSFLPAMMMVLPVRIKPRAIESSTPEWPEKLSQWVISKYRPLLWGTAIITILCISFIPRNEINDEFVKYFDKSMDFRIATDFSAEHLVGPYTIEYSLQAHAADGHSQQGAISEPAFLADVDRFVDYLKTFEQVSHVFTLTDTMKRLNKNLHGDDEAWKILPKQRDLAAQYLLMYEMSLPYGLDLNNQIDVAKSATRVTVTMDNLSTNQVLTLEKTWGEWLDKNTTTLTYAAASTNLMFAHIGYRNAHSLVVGTGIALIAISFILIFALRSLKIGLVSLIPNLVPACLAFGIWGLIDGQVGMSVSIVAGMTLGIVVDDTVHFLSKYLHARRDRKFSSEQAIHYAFSHVGKALVVTSVVLVAGFSMLMLSTFKVNADMGMLTALTISVALMIDFLLLPSLLLVIDRRHTKKTDNVVLTNEASS